MKKRKKVRNQAVLGLRQILGVTQREFALLVGASLDLIKGVESGRNKLSRALARRIVMATGAEPSALVKYAECYLSAGKNSQKNYTMTGTHGYFQIMKKPRGNFLKTLLLHTCSCFC